MSPVFHLATSPIAPVLGQHMPLRGPARLLNRSYARVARSPAPRGEQELITVAGDQFRVRLDSAREWNLWAFGCFEPGIAELLGHLVKSGDRCLDVGANIGVHTVRLARLAEPGGEVIAIEPDPELAARNARNLELNGLSARVVAVAASDRARASLHHHEYLTGEEVQAPTVTVDEVCTGPVALIKIDAEGREAAVVAGAAQTIARDHPVIVFKYAPELLTDPAAQCPFETLATAGYRIFRVCYPRRWLSSRGRLVLEPLPRRPRLGGDLVAMPRGRLADISSLVAVS